MLSSLREEILVRRLRASGAEVRTVYWAHLPSMCRVLRVVTSTEEIADREMERVQTSVVVLLLCLTHWLLALRRLSAVHCPRVQYHPQRTRVIRHRGCGP
jgi:hypothetical protein